MVSAVPIKKEFFIRLLTSKNLGAESFAPGFLDAWFSGNPKLVPERFSHGEPVRHSIEEKGGIPAVLDWWSRGMPMFKRVSRKTNS
ncbi:MAG: hypothetical protein B7Z26_02965 [Asticcacaulis sp. 32-58-5]|nr:MAG: hypothetical protein B7Z26_02965 [Asticcacaulis sp. 32-58-5]